MVFCKENCRIDYQQDSRCCNSEAYHITESEEEGVVCNLTALHPEHFALLPCFTFVPKGPRFSRIHVRMDQAGIDGPPCSSNNGFFSGSIALTTTMRSPHISSLVSHSNGHIKRAWQIRTRAFWRRSIIQPVTRQRCQNALYDDYCCRLRESMQHLLI